MMAVPFESKKSKRGVVEIECVFVIRESGRDLGIIFKILVIHW